MLKISGSIESVTQPGKGVVGVGDNNKARRDGSKLDRSELDGNKVDGGEIEDDKIRKRVQKTFKSKNLFKSKKTVGSLDFLIPGAKLAFTKLTQAFFKALILYHFNSERYIQIETDVSGYAISEVLNQLILDDLGRWYPVAFFSQKMISAETRYETHDSELLAIVKAFKTWEHYLDSSQYEVLVFIDYNNLWQFINTMSLSSRQVYWAQKLSCYHFEIDYY